MAQAERVDIRDKVTGRAIYTEDLPEPPGTLYAAAIRSPYSHARVGAIDSSRAEALPGVMAVLHRDVLATFDVHVDAADHDALHMNLAATDNPFITRFKARYDGDLLGMVVATDLRTARAAAELIDIEYELLPPIFSAAEALAPGAQLIHEEHGSNVAVNESLEWGNVDEAFARAAHVIEGSFTSPTIFHHPMEPAMSGLVHYHDGILEAWGPTNNPFSLVEPASILLGLDEEQVRVHVPYVGGNFGAKHMTGELLVASAITRKLGRPVKYVATEEESFRVTARHAMTYRGRMALDADGTLLGLDVDLEIDTGAYFTGAQVATQNAVSSSWGAYRMPNFRVLARTAYTNKVPAGMFRNTGKNQITFALDSLMDSAAHSLGMNPIEFRLKNVLRKGEQPSMTNWRRNGKDVRIEYPPLDTDFTQLVQIATSEIGWDGRPSDSTPPDSRVARGRGIAVSLRRGASFGDASARARLEEDGTVTIEHNAPDVGEGAHTMISVVAAGTLNVPQSQVRVAEPDTSYQLHFSGTSSQRTTIQMGNAVRLACEQLQAQILEAAAEGFGGSAEDWRMEDGFVRRAEQRRELREIAQRAPGGILEAVGSYERSNRAEHAFGSRDHWSPGVAAVEVEVDRDTGDVKVLKYAAVADAGTVLNYSAAKGQIEGGAVMGFGAALSEEVTYGEGQLLNADAFQYRLPHLSDIPDGFSVSFVENGDGPGPFGSKGIAQTSIPCAPPAIANAIFDAVGARLTSTPFTPQKVLEAMGQLESDQ